MVLSSSLTDAILMASIAKGDQRAFARLVSRHLPKAYSIACRALPRQEDSEEAVQDAFNKVWISAKRFDPLQSKFSTWFYRILVNTCTDHMRAKHKAKYEDQFIDDSQEDGRINAEQTLINQQDQNAVQACVMALPEQQKMAIILCYFEGLKNREAADVMGLHIKALEGLLVRARAKLRTVLEVCDVSKAG
jgi:RNA polymerase sigma-70 factor (ECF subfamily)